MSEPAPVLYIERGRELAQGLAACGFCHGQTADAQSPLSGGRIQHDAYGEVAAPNITPHSSGIATIKTMELMQIFRAGIAPDERRLSRAVHKGFEWLSDNDLLAIIAFLKFQPPVANEVEKREVGFIERNTAGFLESTFEVTGFVPEIEKSYPVEYGKYLLDHVARCGSCHNTPATLITDEAYLSGGALIKIESGEKIAPNITTSNDAGIGSWSEDDIVHYLQSGETPEGRVSDAKFCPVDFYRNASPEDLVSIAKYLKTVAPN
ncbi:MAG: hypothetical protein J5J00_14245 [Deltaproteobacteria bacterium]|nr:hypothetical protein [Deltaproteobacteria bacterium]